MGWLRSYRERPDGGPVKYQPWWKQNPWNDAPRTYRGINTTPSVLQILRTLSKYERMPKAVKLLKDDLWRANAVAALSPARRAEYLERNAAKERMLTQPGLQMIRAGLTKEQVKVAQANERKRFDELYPVVSLKGLAPWPTQEDVDAEIARIQRQQLRKQQDEDDAHDAQCRDELDDDPEPLDDDEFDLEMIEEIETTEGPNTQAEPIAMAESVSEELVSAELVSKEVVSEEVLSKGVVSKKVVLKEVVLKEVVLTEVVLEEVLSKEVASKEVVSKEPAFEQPVSEEVDSMEELDSTEEPDSTEELDSTEQPTTPEKPESQKTAKRTFEDFLNDEAWKAHDYWEEVDDWASALPEHVALNETVVTTLTRARYKKLS